MPEPMAPGSHLSTSQGILPHPPALMLNGSSWKQNPESLSWPPLKASGCRIGLALLPLENPLRTLRPPGAECRRWIKRSL